MAMDYNVKISGNIGSIGSIGSISYSNISSSISNIGASDCCGYKIKSVTYDEWPIPNAIKKYICDIKTKLYKKGEPEFITLDVDRIVFNDPATIVFWADGTKTIVKRSPKEKPNKYNAFCAAVTKRIFENNSQIRKIVESGFDQVAHDKANKVKKGTKK